MSGAEDTFESRGRQDAAVQVLELARFNAKESCCKVPAEQGSSCPAVSMSKDFVQTFPLRGTDSKWAVWIPQDKHISSESFGENSIKKGVGTRIEWVEEYQQNLGIGDSDQWFVHNGR
ncbi:hypothetical protein llap_11757 [Limosa lapponica baueri]|uniref:Uncharacterized protein n=1 Tax=Limosa lapponica baueri TaxID=1758121 RepID=A0A2I0TVW3_LIMLA|nr:hypothetical protein llap_11757 [Limosa lapponica baueri]